MKPYCQTLSVGTVFPSDKTVISKGVINRVWQLQCVVVVCRNKVVLLICTICIVAKGNNSGARVDSPGKCVVWPIPGRALAPVPGDRTPLCRLSGRLDDLISEPTRAVGATVTAGTVTLIRLPRRAR